MIPLRRAFRTGVQLTALLSTTRSFSTLRPSPNQGAVGVEEGEGAEALRGKGNPLVELAEKEEVDDVGEERGGIK